MQVPLIILIAMAPIGAATLCYGLMLHPWRPRRMIARRVPSVDLLFCAGVVAGCLAVVEPAPFDRIAVALVETTDLPLSLADVDQRIAEIENLPERMWTDLTARLGWASDAATDAELVPPGEGPVASTVLPAVHSIVSVLIRGFTWAGSVALLVIALVLRGVAGLRRREAKPAGPSRFDRLIDDRVAALEEALQTEQMGAASAEPQS